MKTIFVISLAVLLTGCISTEHSSDRANQKVAVNADGLVCKREKPTGSHRSVRICRTVSEVEHDKEEAAETTRRARNQSQISTGSR
jgi:starvation-inducible outer membrane lipoprotein